MRRSIWLALAGAAWLYGCSGGGGSGGGLGGAVSPDDSKVAAEIEGERVTEADLDRRAKDELFARETQGGDPSLVYELRRAALDALIEERALNREAEKRGLTVDALVSEEAAARGGVTDEDVSKFYEQYKANMQGRTLEQIAPQIRGHLEGLRQREVRAAIVSQAQVKVMLDAPRVTVGTSGPSQGPADAQITMVEFSDFQCPFCARALPTIKELLAKYPTQLRVVYRHLPLESIHPRARPAAEAAVCAEEQGQFWAFHDRLFQNQGALSDAQLREHAKALKLDLAKYDACLGGSSAKARIEADLADANAAGISGTPGFVINGLLVRGLQPTEEFAKMIDRELAVVAQASPAEAPKASP
jgi:protein-disulfide isomerase